MNNPLRIGIAGLGTVGAATVGLLQTHANLLAARAGRPITITAVTARDPDKDRPFNKDGLKFLANPMELATNDNVDCVVELIGGESGIAKDLVRSALAHGKHLVTANKALIARHGFELAEIAEEQGVTLAFEAAVAGGIPVVKALREGLSGNQISAVYGILNGTCNFILTNMMKTGRSFDVVLKEAQDKGYAEADPTFDVDGIDTAHKLAILASIAFGTAPQIGSVTTEGIRHITLEDLKYAAELDFAIKLLGSATMTEQGIVQGVYPYLVPNSSPLAHVDDVLNAVSIHGDMVGSAFLEGPGAGGNATASSVVADIMDVAKGTRYFPLGIPAESLSQERSQAKAKECCYYLRTSTNDEVGVLADITRLCHGQNISVDIMTQPRHTPGEPAQLVFTTHPTTAEAITAAGAAINALPAVITQPQIIRIMS